MWVKSFFITSAYFILALPNANYALNQTNSDFKIQNNSNFSIFNTNIDTNISSILISSNINQTDSKNVTMSKNWTELLSSQSDMIIHKGISCFHPKWVNTFQDLKNRRWDFALGDTPALVYPFCSDSTSLGNWLGLYFNEASCALLTGGHLIAPPIGFGWAPQNTTGNLEKFFEAFPKIVANPSPLPYDKVMENMATVCKCPRFCWDDSASPMFKNTPWITTITRKAIEAYLTTVNASRGTKLSPNIDLSNVPIDQPLPLIPDVALQYRCGDNMAFGNIGYGILPFRAFLNIIPSNAKYIYILTDPPKRLGGGNHPFVHHCHSILTWLFEFIVKHFPNSTVIVKHGGDLYLDFARLAFANTTICSASTFCLFPAIAHNGSIVYFPQTKLIGVPPKNYYMNDHFTWLSNYPLITEVLKPWYLIEYALNDKQILSSDIEGHLVKGHGRSIYLIKNQTKYEFPNGDTFEGLGFKWDDVWHLGDSDISVFANGGEITPCDGKSCESNKFYNKTKL